MFSYEMIDQGRFVGVGHLAKVELDRPPPVSRSGRYGLGYTCWDDFLMGEEWRSSVLFVFAVGGLASGGIIRAQR